MLGGPLAALCGMTAERWAVLDAVARDHGAEWVKPCWARAHFSYQLAEEEVEHIVAAVCDVARYGWRLLPQYVVDPTTGELSRLNGLC
jgi:hypothetical protein